MDTVRDLNTVDTDYKIQTLIRNKSTSKDVTNDTPYKKKEFIRRISELFMGHLPYEKTYWKKVEIKTHDNTYIHVSHNNGIIK